MLSCESGSRFAVGSRLRETVFEIGTLSMDRLRPAIVDITPEGLTLDCTATGLQLDLQESEEKFRGLLAIHLEVVQADGPIIVTGTVEGTALRQCVRCLAEYADPLFVSVYAEFLKNNRLRSPNLRLRGRGDEGAGEALNRRSRSKSRKMRTSCITTKASTSISCRCCESRSFWLRRCSRSVRKTVWGSVHGAGRISMSVVAAAPLSRGRARFVLCGSAGKTAARRRSLTGSEARW